MSRILDRAKAGARLKTYSELRSILGTERQPCPKCGSAIFVVLQTGEVICKYCEESAIRPAFEVIILVLGGRFVLHDLAAEIEEAARRRQAVYEAETAEWDRASPHGPLAAKAAALRKATGLPPLEVSIPERWSWFAGRKPQAPQKPQKPTEQSTSHRTTPPSPDWLRTDPQPPEWLF